MDDDPHFIGNGTANLSLARRLGLRHGNTMEDWKRQAAEPDRFDAWLAFYQRGRLSNEGRRSLMAMLVQCVDNAHDKPRGAPMWRAIEPWLVRHGGLHRDLIGYWAQESAECPEPLFCLSLEMRRVKARIARAQASELLGHEAWARGELGAALTHFHAAAAEDDANLMNVGYFHDEGLGKPRSKHDAMRCYLAAGRAGSSGAATNVAILHRERGDTRRMARWFARAAAMDDGDAAFELARCEIAGLGTPRWRSRAIAQARKAARSAHVTPDCRDQAKALLSALTSATPRQLHRIRRHR